jgi:[ribosomal protein S18]-alanine N-acetyltransferase
VSELASEPSAQPAAGTTDAVATAGIRIEPMAPADIARCVELEKVLFPEDDPWPDVAFRSELAGAHNRYLVAREESGCVVGYGGIALLGNLEYPEAEVHTIGVDPAHQGRGIGRALLRALLEVADAAHATVFLEVRTDNAAAHALYAAEGFTVVGLRRRYYAPSGADAHTMRRDPR